MSEDDEEADLITGMKKSPRRIMSKILYPRMIPWRLVKLFLVLVVIVMLFILFYSFKQSDTVEIIEQKQYVERAILKSPMFCSSMESSKKSSTYFLESMAKPSSKTRSPGRVLLVPKNSYTKGCQKTELHIQPEI